MQTQEGYRAYRLPFSRNGQQIYGQLYLPATEAASYPLVIIGHGFGSSHRSTAPAARDFARAGIAAYVFDFIGGSPHSASGGSMTDMSVLTEEEDMHAVLDGLRASSLVQERNVFLMGESQGGFVAALLAAKVPDEVRGLVLLYPALVIPDDARSRYPSLEDTPSTYRIMGLPVGRKYAQDVWDMDAIDAIRDYAGDVLLIHGDRDGIVPISYSQRAKEAYQHAQLVTIEGGGHGFDEIDFRTAMDLAIAFVKERLAQ